MTIVLGLGLPCFLFAQTRASDLAISVHKTEYIGDSVKLKALTEPLRGQHPLIKRSDLCSEVIQDIGTLLVDDEKHLVLYVNSGFGNSCRGIRTILFFKQEELIGLYRTSYVLKLKVKGSQIIYQHEGSKSFEAIEFAMGFPDRVALTNEDYSQFWKPKN